MQTCTDRLADPNSDLQYRPLNPYFDGHKTEIGSELLQPIFKLRNSSIPFDVLRLLTHLLNCYTTLPH